ncbi:MAG: hypothetical protein KF763_10030 [Cyclobacteriaceae bacterium]|nr:hypothetical protein [Cyclobacteriaceae bacterium]
MKSTAIVIVLVTVAIAACAQNFSGQVLQWDVNETENLKNDERTGYSCSFVSTPQEIKWIQRNGTRSTTFNVVSTLGTWPDILQDGAITLNVMRGTDKGIVTFSRNNGQHLVMLDFSASGSSAIKQKFFISSVQPYK